jgi:hypothetical protein
MQSPVVHHTFAAETLRCLYHIFGYDFLFNELHFIHHLHSSHDSSNSILSPPSIIVPPHQSTDSSNSILSPTALSTALPIAPTPRSKYSRAPPPDHLRCSALTARGSRCTFSIYADSLCSQHQHQT